MIHSHWLDRARRTKPAGGLQEKQLINIALIVGVLGAAVLTGRYLARGSRSRALVVAAPFLMMLLWVAVAQSPGLVISAAVIGSATYRMLIDSLDLPVSETMASFALEGLFVMLLLYAVTSRKARSWRLSSIDKAIVTLMIAVALSIVAHPGPPMLVALGLRYFLRGFVVYLAISLLDLSEGVKRWLVWLILIVALVQIPFVGFQYATKILRGSSPDAGTGTFGPTGLGGYLLGWTVLAGCCLVNALRVKRVISQKVGWLVWTAFVVVLWMAGSLLPSLLSLFTPWLVDFLGVGKATFRQVLLVTIVLLVGVTVFYVIQIPLFSTAVQDIAGEYSLRGVAGMLLWTQFDPETRLSSGRLNTLAYAWQLITTRSKDPLNFPFGYGLGATLKSDVTGDIGYLALRVVSPYSPNPFHFDLARSLAEMGVIGTGAFIYLFVVCWRYGFVRAQATCDPFWAGVALAFAALAVYVLGLLMYNSSIVVHFPLQIMFWMLGGLVRSRELHLSRRNQHK